MGLSHRTPPPRTSCNTPATRPTVSCSPRSAVLCPGQLAVAPAQPSNTVPLASRAGPRGGRLPETPTAAAMVPRSELDDPQHRLASGENGRRDAGRSGASGHADLTFYCGATWLAGDDVVRP